MNLVAAVTQHLSDSLLAQLAQASGMPLAEARQYSGAAVAVLVKELAQPTDADEQNARWDMCRQLYLSQLLTDSGELLRTDLGWPNRRRILAEKIISAEQFAALVANHARATAAGTMLGYLTILVLAIIGQQASQADLDPQRMSEWLGEQLATVAGTPAAKPLRTAAKPAAAAAPATASTSRYLKLGSVVGGLVVAGFAGYFLMGAPANAESAPAAASVAAPSAAVTPAVAAPEPVAATTPAAPVPAPAAPAEAAAATPATAAAKPAAAAAVAGAMLRDTLGNASMARFIGGKFNVAAGRYIKDNGQPLTIKLINRATLMVGINSSESLLYKRLANPALPRPTDIVLDRLAFDAGQARLGAEGAQQLSSVASLLKTFPKAKLLVLGHANQGESDASKLGLKRATAAVEELQKQGISPERLQAQGVLATGTPTDNDSPERQAMLQGISLKISRL